MPKTTIARGRRARSAQSGGSVARRTASSLAKGAIVDIYHIWFNLKPGTGDTELADRLGAYLGHLKEQGLIVGWRLTRRKLGLAPRELGDFHAMIEIRDLAQLDQAFARVASRGEPVEGLHFAVNSMVSDAVFALYRDFPDPVRQRGAEKF
jgi:hypothetical protein